MGTGERVLTFFNNPDHVPFNVYGLSMAMNTSIMQYIDIYFVIPDPSCDPTKGMYLPESHIYQNETKLLEDYRDQYVHSSFKRNMGLR